MPQRNKKGKAERPEDRPCPRSIRGNREGRQESRGGPPRRAQNRRLDGSGPPAALGPGHGQDRSKAPVPPVRHLGLGTHLRCWPANLPKGATRRQTPGPMHLDDTARSCGSKVLRHRGADACPAFPLPLLDGLQPDRLYRAERSGHRNAVVSIAGAFLGVKQAVKARSPAPS